MAKNWTLWRNDENDNDDGATQHETGRKYQSLWDATDDENFENDDVFGGSGYSGPIYEGDIRSDEYRYEETIDDSDLSWYRQSGFRYSRHVDYSPSRLFRSAFTTKYYSLGNNEAQNKAVRALRVLTRNANTITDKSTKGSYAVQYSSGADSNGLTDKLNDDKQRIVFVSPDELLATTTTEDEDNVVDALTGFVLLRVQMAQTVDADTIASLNASNDQGLGLYISQQLFDTKKQLEDIADEDLAKIAAGTADRYLAGVLAKSVLMRLARRGVVENWGGFAPYFIRHAKKFSAMRETLLAAELTLDTLVGQIAYNTLDDETPIELPEFAVTVMGKHLGTAVEPEKLLDVCTTVVAELRTHMAATAAAGGGVGGIESDINDFLQKMKEQRKEKTTGKSELQKFMETLAGAAYDAAKVRDSRQEGATACELEDAATKRQLSENKSVEQLLRRLEKTLERLAATTDPYDRNVAFNDLKYDLEARPKAAKVLERNGHKDKIDDLRDAVLAAMTRPRGDSVEKEIEDIKEAVKNLAAAAKDAVAEETKKAESGLQTKLEHAEKLLQKLREQAEELAKKMREAYANTESSHESIASDFAYAAREALSNAISAARPNDDLLAQFIKDVQAMQEKLPRTRTAGGAEKIANELQNILRALRDNPSLNAPMNDYATWHSNPTMGHLARGIQMAHDKERDDAVASAVTAAMNDKNLQSSDIIASAINELFKPDTAHPDGLASYDGDAIQNLQKANPGYEKTIERLWHLLRDLQHNSSADKDTASKTGESLKQTMDEHGETMAPVDQELFGKKIKAMTKVLDGTAIGQANDEARNAQEEEYIAYIHGGKGATAKPVVRTEKEYAASSSKKDGPVAVIKKACQQYRSFIERIRNALQFQAGKRTEEQYGLRSGDLDEGGLHKLNYDCEHIWSKKTTSRLPDVAVGILVDQSGSMSGKKIADARTLCIILAEALRKIAGVRLYVYGHTANSRTGADLTIFEHYTPTMGQDLTQLGNIRAHTNNYDGFAIKDVAKRLMNDPAKKKYLFVIADGLPAGSGYGGSDAQRHVASVCKFIRNKLKIGLYAFAVGISGYERKTFKEQYDENHIVFVDNVMKCLPQIVRFLRNALQKEKQLVAEAAD